jgi:hypothetical protein
MDKLNQELESTAFSHTNDHNPPTSSVSQLTSYTGSGDPSSARSKADREFDRAYQQEYLEFLERTQLDKSRPEQYIIPTSPGRYRQFEEQIAVHRHYVELECGCNIPFEEATAHWYDRVYCPIVDIIHQKHMLRLFPGRTEADLVNWIIRNKDRLRQRYGARDAPTEALAQEATDLAHANPWRRLLPWIQRKVFRWPVYTGQPWQP